MKRTDRRIAGLTSARIGHDCGVSLIDLPTTTMSDAELATLLRRTVALIDPLLDLLAEADPLGLREHTRSLGSADGVLAKVRDALAWALDAGDVPGTRAWDAMTVDARVDWWVHRVGRVSTVAVAYPGVLGALGDRLPLQDVLGFTSQAIMLCAVAREYGVVEHERQARLVAAVLCDRDLSAEVVPGPAVEVTPSEPTSQAGITQTLWRLVGVVRGITGELAKRPRSRRVYRYLGKLPAIGAFADYFGEYGALVRTAKAGRRWIAQHPR